MAPYARLLRRDAKNVVMASTYVDTAPRGAVAMIGSATAEFFDNVHAHCTHAVHAVRNTGAIYVVMAAATSVLSWRMRQVVSDLRWHVRRYRRAAADAAGKSHAKHD